MNFVVKSFWVFLLLVASTANLWSQEVTIQATTDEQLAAYYYRQGDFEKAVLYYEKLYGDHQNDEYYQYYLNCLLALEDYKEAEKLSELQSKRNPGNYGYRVDIGRVYLRSGDQNKADRYFDKLIKELDKASINQIIDLGKAFADMDDPDRALAVFYKGRKMVGDSYPFHFQIAQVLSQKNDIEGMINEYLDVLMVSKGYLQSVQNTLNRVIGFDEENQYNAILEQQLMERVQKSPDEDIYAQMLVWMLVRQNRYQAALLQVQALDKRNREDGGRVMALARTAMENYNYATAVKAFQYVIDKGANGYYYSEAVTSRLKALKQQVINGDYDASEINALKDAYAQTLTEFGKRSSTWEIMLDYAHVEAFYRSKFDPTAVSNAIDLLNEALVIGGLSEEQRAIVKIALADVYVLKGLIWDASLLYGQVEKRFKYDEIGFEAKLKNAKVFYYSGDFGWSQAQLDVLKGSTSKLIANDAMELSSFISENTGLDSTTEALSVFAQAELYVAQHKYDSALFMLNLIEANFPGHALADNLRFERGQIAAAQGEFEKAAGLFLEVVSIYPDDILADNALMEAARIHDQVLEKRQEAMDLYERMLTEYPGSLFVVEARKRFRSLRGDQIN